MTNDSNTRWLVRCVAVTLIAGCLWQALQTGAFTATGPVPQVVQASLAFSSPARENSRTGWTDSSVKPSLKTRPIRDLRPGMRVLADNPEQYGPALPDADIHADTWRLVRLQMTKPGGGLLDIELLRPVEWLAMQALLLIDREGNLTLLQPRPLTVAVEDAPLADVLLGRTIELDLPELGASGPAFVQALLPCPAIESAMHPERRVVTGTFRHSAGNVIDLQIEGESEPLGVTDNHLFWSADRRQFVPCVELAIGEHLQRADGTLAQVTRITPRRGPPVEVFNLEVDAEHVYYVGKNGALVHNSYPFGSHQFGNMMHSKFGNFLLDTTGQKLLVDRTAKGLTGVDGTFKTPIDGLTDWFGRPAAGFKHAELKPLTESAYHHFLRQSDSWRADGLVGNIGLFMYDASQYIHFIGTY